MALNPIVFTESGESAQSDPIRPHAQDGSPAGHIETYAIKGIAQVTYAATHRRSGQGYEALVEAIKGMALTMDSLGRQTVRAYAPVVEELVLSRSRDIRRIEETLDDLLSFCGYRPALDLYKTLCRHYLTIDSAATADYVHMYCDMWDSD